MHLEIERKFLLKCLPNKTPDDIIVIDQYYWKNSKGIWERARTYHSNLTGDKYVHTIKKSISKNVNIEDEREMSKEEFESFRLKCLKNPNSKFIIKERHIYDQGPLKWEVDVFDSGYHLIIAEIEIPKKNYKLTIPDYIEKVMLLEVTGLKQFSNRALSIEIRDLP